MSKIGFMTKQEDVGRLPKLFFSFLVKVVRGFMRNKGLLLSGAIAYYTLLSIVPMSILTLVGLSHLVKEESLFQTISIYVGMVMPGYAAILSQQVKVFLEHRHAIGVVGVLAMLFFSSMAFSVLENAMSMIFLRQVRGQRRHFLISFIIPYVFIFSIGLGIALISITAGTIEILQKKQLVVLDWTLGLEAPSRVMLYTVGIISEVLLLTSIYLIMPAVRIRFRHALIGGITATVLWEITRRVLVWYYSTLSMVNLIYGSFATAVVALLIAEAVALIILLGAQVIAELESKPNELVKEKQQCPRHD
jgi:YihY family inner membrane protein